MIFRSTFLAALLLIVHSAATSITAAEEVPNANAQLVKAQIVKVRQGEGHLLSFLIRLYDYATTHCMMIWIYRVSVFKGLLLTPNYYPCDWSQLFFGQNYLSIASNLHFPSLFVSLTPADYSHQQNFLRGNRSHQQKLLRQRNRSHQQKLLRGQRRKWRSLRGNRRNRREVKVLVQVLLKLSALI